MMLTRSSFTLSLNKINNCINHITSLEVFLGGLFTLEIHSLLHLCYSFTLKNHSDFTMKNVVINIIRLQIINFYGSFQGIISL